MTPEKAAAIKAHAERVAESWPPLTEEQASQVAALLYGRDTQKRIGIAQTPEAK